MSGIITTGGGNGPLAGGGHFAPVTVKTSGYTPAPGDFVPVDTTSSAVTVPLPTQPADGTNITVRIVKGGANAVTITAGGSDVFNAVGGGQSQVLSGLYQGMLFQYSAAIGVWYVFDFPGHVAGPSFTTAYAPAVVALTDAATITINAALGNDFRVTLAGNRTLANPTNPTDGQQILIQPKQDPTGSRTLTYGTAYDFGTSGVPTLTTTASKIDVLKFVYNAAAGKWLFLGANLGF